MSAINKIQLPNGTSYDLHDARITGVTSIPADQDTDVITSDGSYNNLVSCDIIPDEDVPETVESKAMDVKMEYLNSMLAQAPKITLRGKSSFEIEHPLIDINYPGVECILVCYRKRNGKIRTDEWEESFGRYGPRKKGFCVLRNDHWDDGYFNFLDYSQISNFASFLGGVRANRYTPAGVVVRIPNPKYDGPSTHLRNASYKGVKEMLWSDIKRIKISNVRSVGLTF